MWIKAKNKKRLEFAIGGKARQGQHRQIGWISSVFRLHHMAMTRHFKATSQVRPEGQDGGPKVVNPKQERNKEEKKKKRGKQDGTFFACNVSFFFLYRLRVRWHRVVDVSTRVFDPSGTISGRFVSVAAERPVGHFRPFASTNRIHWCHWHSRRAPGPSKRLMGYCCWPLLHCRMDASSVLDEDGHPTPWIQNSVIDTLQR